MPPARSQPNLHLGKRGGSGAFKTPRPAVGTEENQKPASKPQRGRPSTRGQKATGTRGKPSASRGGFRSAASIGVSDDDDDDDEDGDEDSGNEPSAGVEADEDRQPVEDSVIEPNGIPKKLLTRLIHEALVDKDMKIGQGAMDVFSKYIEIFVKEAVARAALERRERIEESGVDDDFLEVEDLERLVPQLLLDF